MNKKHLAHNYYTDVLTYDYRTNPNEIYGDLFISKERIIENASFFKVSVNKELLRVIVHGLLHLFGYTDKFEKDKKLLSFLCEFSVLKVTPKTMIAFET